LKEQQAARKSAILAAFNANMETKTYDSTYGGQPVDRNAVEAFYNEMISAYPPGTVERDKLMAELAEFRNSALKAEMAAYSEAYQDGTFAFGEQITMNKYLAFLRDAKSMTNSPADKILYTKEEFLVGFNDVNMDLKAKGASASKFVSFYQRELKRAEEMGLTKDMQAYRTIQGYLRDAMKQAAVDGRNQMYGDAVDFVSKRVGVIGNALDDALAVAVNKGVLDYATRLSLGTDTMTLTQNFFKLQPDVQARILIAGREAGVLIGGDPLTSTAIVEGLRDLREKVKVLATGKGVDSATRDRMTSLLDQIDEKLAGPAGMISDVEKADRSYTDLVIDSAKMFGNPVANADAYARHADRLDRIDTGDIVGQAMKDILRGFIPEGGKDFGGKRFLYELNTQQEIDMLVDKYSSSMFTGDMAPADFIRSVVNDYKVQDDVRNRRSHLAFVINDAGDPEVTVSDGPVTGGVPTFLSAKASDGTTISMVANQPSMPVMNAAGQVVGQKVFFIDDKTGRQDFFVTNDQQMIPMDRMELYLDNLGIGVSTNNNGETTITTTDAIKLLGEQIKTDPVYGKYVSQYRGIAVGPGGAQAITDIAKTVVNNLTQTGTVPAVFGKDALGNLTVLDEDAAFAITGMNASGLNALLNTNIARPLRDRIDTMVEAARRGVDGGALAGQAPETFKTPTGETSLTPTPEQAQARTESGYIASQRMFEQDLQRRRAAENIKPLMDPSNVFYAAGVGPFGLGGVLNQPLPGEQQFKFAPEAEAAKTRQRLAEEMKFSPYVSQANPAFAPLDTSYAFRYVGGNLTPGGVTSKTPDTTAGVKLTTGGGFANPKIPQFTPTQISQSLVDFRAGERASLNISSTSATNK